MAHISNRSRCILCDTCSYASCGDKGCRKGIQKGKAHCHCLIREFYLHPSLFMGNGLAHTQELSRLLDRRNTLHPHPLYRMVSHIYGYSKGRCAMGDSPSTMEYNPSGCAYAFLSLHPCWKDNTS